jgi:hypothetical protein
MDKPVKKCSFLIPSPAGVVSQGRLKGGKSMKAQKSFFPGLGNRGKTVSALTLLALVAFCITLPLFVYRMLPDSNDIIIHFFHAGQFASALHEGFFPPRWALDAYHGYGSPYFIFYAPMSYAFVAAFQHFFPPLFAFITAIWLSFFLSGTAMFIAVTRIFGRAAGFWAAFFYQIMPFHLFGLYQVGGFAELFAFVWFPLIIYFACDLKKGGGRRAFLGLSLSYAGLVMTHLVSAFIFSFIIGLYLIYGFLTGDNKTKMIPPILALLLGLGLSSVYLMPAAFEQKFVHIDSIIKYWYGNYRNNYLSVPDVLHQQGFQLWMRIYTFMELLLFLVIILLLHEKRRGMTGAGEKNFFVLFFVTSLLMTTPLSGPVWAIVPGLPMIQFPWRWLSMVEVSLAFLIGAVFSTEERPGIRSSDLKKRMTVYLLLVFVVAAINIVINIKLLPVSYYDKFVGLREYTPIWVTDREKVLSEVRPPKVLPVAGTASCRVTLWKSEERKFSVEAPTPVTLRIATFYFPGWKAGLDHHSVLIRIEQGTGAMLLDVPAGRHEVLLRFGDTPLRRDAGIISLVSLFMLAAIVTVYDAAIPGRRRRDFSGRGGGDE